MLMWQIQKEPTPCPKTQVIDWKGGMLTHLNVLDVRGQWSKKPFIHWRSVLADREMWQSAVSTAVNVGHPAPSRNRHRHSYDHGPRCLLLAGCA